MCPSSQTLNVLRRSAYTALVLTADSGSSQWNQKSRHGNLNCLWMLAVCTPLTINLNIALTCYTTATCSVYIRSVSSPVLWFIRPSSQSNVSLMQSV